MAELDVSVLNSTERGSGEMEERMKTTSHSAIAHEHSEYVTAFESGIQSSSCTTSAQERRAYGVWLEQVHMQCKSEEEFMTAISKPTWSEVASLTSGSAPFMLSAEKVREIHGTNQQFFQELMKKQPQPTCEQNGRGVLGEPTEFDEFEEIIETSAFFIDFGGRLEVGKKIAQGGQAEIYEALFDGKNAIFIEKSLVLKVFPLEHSEWFQHAWGKELESIYTQDYELYDIGVCCFVMKCTLLKDGRFAFLMWRYWGDLCKAISVQILKNKTHVKPPFPPSISTNIIYQIARGMETLHDGGILHRDLKAANVLVSGDIERWLRHSKDYVKKFVTFNVADFESSEGVMRTRFWRAPEVLNILRSTSKDKYSDPTIWTEKVDVYAYGMTCYEVLSGCIPFQFRGSSDYNIGDERPPLPDYVDREIQELLRKCWDYEPSKRPTFESICNELLRFIGRKIKCYKALAEDERDDEAKRWLQWPYEYIDESGAKQYTYKFKFGNC